jgi:hypothetical protein
MYRDFNLPEYAMVQPESISRAFCANAWRDQTRLPMEIVLSPLQQFTVTCLRYSYTKVSITDAPYPDHDRTRQSEYTCACAEKV